MVILVPPDQHISDAWSITEPWLGVLRISSVSMAWTLVGNGDSWTPVQTYVVCMQFRFEEHWSGTDRPFWKVISQTLLPIKESGQSSEYRQTPPFKISQVVHSFHLVNKELCLHLK